MKYALLLVYFFLFSIPLSAHGDIHLLIQQLNLQIQAEPTNDALFLKRGQLYAKDGDINQAEKDYLFARQLNPTLLLTDLLLAQLYLQDNQVESALIFVRTFLKNKPNDADGLLTRARIYTLQQQASLAKQDIQQAFLFLKQATSKHYIFIAETTLLADSTDLKTALYWLHQGQKKLGFDIVLIEKEMDLLAHAQEYDAAINLIDTVMPRFQRQEKWCLKKAQLLEADSKKETALFFYKKTLAQLQKLPKRLQRTSKMLLLETQVLEALERLSS